MPADSATADDGADRRPEARARAAVRVVPGGRTAQPRLDRMVQVLGEALGERAHGTRRFPDAAGLRRDHRRHVLPPPQAPRGRRGAPPWRGAPAASADSIAYVKDGDVWLSTPTARASTSVTSERRLQRRLAGRRRHDDRASTACACTGWTAQGHVLADFDTPVSDTRPAPRQDVLRPVRPGDLARRHEGRLHLLLDDPEPEPDLLPARRA